MSSTYASVFKIDGVPILPPVMTPNRREEMRILRDLAVKVEQRLRVSRQKPPKKDRVDAVIVVQSPEPDFDETATSETLPTDIVAPQQPTATPEPVPPEDSPEGDGEEFTSPKLIRSNSYTLDQPSPMLLKFLDSAGDISATASPVTKIKHNKSPSPGNRKKSPRKLSDPMKLRGIYGLKASPVRKAKNESLDDTKRRLMIHSKGEKVEKFFMKSKTVKDFQDLTQKSKVHPDLSLEKETPRITIESQNVEEDDDNKENTLSSIGDGDQDEPRKCSDIIPVREQTKPLLQLQTRFVVEEMDRTSTPVQKNTAADIEESHFNETSFFSIIRGESPMCSMSLVSDAYSKQYLNSLRSFTASPTLRQLENVEIAATIINSYVRGYLIRRLLRTEFVQNIIDNIKNILFQILDSNPRELQLKRSYLQQLNGNCERLHDVFFKFSTQERMQVICKDREILLERLSQRRSKHQRPSSMLAIKN